MDKIKSFLINYYTKDTEIDIALFKILGTGGIILSLVSGMQSILVDISVLGGLIDFAAALAGVFLLWFVEKTGKYVYGYIITDLAVFMGLFAILFFEMGGMEGSMTFFFTFGIVFVFLMFRGVLLVIMETLQVAFYTFLCIYSIRHPESVTPFESMETRYIDQISGILLAGLAIGLIFMVYIAQYRKQQRLAEQASLAKSRFLAGMSHEIRTPINMMMGMNEMIIRESDNDTIKEYAANAQDAGRQLLFVVNQVLQYSKAEVGKDELICAEYDFFKLIGSLKEFFEKEAEKKGLKFDADIDTTIVPVMVGDMHKIAQILTNLMTNAIKYTNSGSVALSVKNLGESNGKLSIRFEVKDTGIGIEEKDFKRIFESFERTDMEKNSNVDGTGLGLAIAQDLAKLMDSKIDVESEYGKGSTFGLTLSQAIGSGKGVDEQKKKKDSFVAPEARILAVDDNVMNLNVLKSLLKKTMIRVSTASSAKECYELCENEGFDLILLDLMMPEIDGITALKHLRNMDTCRNTPIVVLTADVISGTREKLIAEGFDGYLSKPIDWSELEECLMNRLPSDLVTRTHESINDLISAEEEVAFAEILAEHDIDLSEGLHYLGGDIVQYAKVASYFASGSDAALEKLDRCMAEKDLKGVTYILHSLKGTARNVGSVELHYMAKRMEKRCRDNDSDYIVSSMPLLKFEWNRVKEGLLEFLETMRPVMDRLEAAGRSNSAESGQATLEAILEAAANCRQTPALKLIDSYLETCENNNVAAVLKQASEKIADIDFDEAEEIIKGLIGE